VRRALLILFWALVSFTSLFIFLSAWQGMAMARGEDLGLLEPDSILFLVIQVGGGLSAFGCWLGSIALWARIPRSGLLHWIALVLLVPLGLFVGPLYILFRVHVLSELPKNPA
jgi:hypothetical protein